MARRLCTRFCCCSACRPSSPSTSTWERSRSSQGGEYQLPKAKKRLFVSGGTVVGVWASKRCDFTEVTWCISAPGVFGSQHRPLAFLCSHPPAASCSLQGERGAPLLSQGLFFSTPKPFFLWHQEDAISARRSSVPAQREVCDGSAQCSACKAQHVHFPGPSRLSTQALPMPGKTILPKNSVSVL